MLAVILTFYRFSEKHPIICICPDSVVSDSEVTLSVSRICARDRGCSSEINHLY